MNFISLGSGSSGNCYCIFTENTGLMIDVGLGVRTLKKLFCEYGLSFSKINAILLTHDHADHVKSVGSLSHDLSVPVFSTKKVHAGVRNNYCVRHKVAPGYERYLEKNKTITIGDLEITPFDVPHDSTDNVGYMLTHQGVNFCLITDAGHVTDEMKSFIQKANYLVLEANYDEEMLRVGTYPDYLKERISGPNGHLSNSTCGKILAENATPALRHVWLCHLSEENNHPELARITVEQVLRQHGIAPGKDFLVEILKRKTPSGLYDLE